MACAWIGLQGTGIQEHPTRSQSRVNQPNLATWTQSASERSMGKTAKQHGRSKHAAPQPRRPPLPGRLAAGATHSIAKTAHQPHTLRAQHAAAAQRARPQQSLFLEGLTSEAESFAVKVRALACEALREAPGRALGLAELGARIRDLAPRRGLSGEAEGKVQSISKRVKACFGGWEGFVRDHGEGFVLANGVLRERDTAAPMADGAPPAAPPPPVPTAAEVNALSLGLSLRP